MTLRFFPRGAFTCPSCGATFAVDGEYFDGPRPRSMDRYPMSFRGTNLVFDTGMVDHPSMATRLLAVPDIIGCFTERASWSLDADYPLDWGLTGPRESNDIPPVGDILGLGG